MQHVRYNNGVRMNWPHWRTGWAEKHFGPWFIQYSVFVQWSRPRHAITLFALSVDPFQRKSVSDEVAVSNRFLMLDLSLLGLCLHVTFCRAETTQVTLRGLNEPS